MGDDRVARSSVWVDEDGDLVRDVVAECPTAGRRPVRGS